MTYKGVATPVGDLDIAELRQSLGLTQRDAALLMEVALNTWARWERGELQLHPARAQQLHRLLQLVNQYGEGPFWGLGIDGIRSVLDGLTLNEALLAHGLDAYGAPLRR